MVKIILSVGLIFILLNSEGQQAPASQLLDIPSKYSLSIGSFLAYHYPGFSVGIDKAKLVTVPSKKTKKPKVKYLALLGFQVAGFSKKDFNTNLNWQFLFALRSESSRGFFSDIGIGQGMAHTFLNAPAYRISASGNMTQVNPLVNNYGYTTGFLKTGIDFSKTRTRKDVAAYFRPSISLMWPYNNFLFPYIINEIGITFKLNKQ